MGHAIVPMDEALVEAVVDISGRRSPGLVRGLCRAPAIGTMDTQLVEEFFRALAAQRAA